MTVLLEGFAIESGPNQYRCDQCGEIFDKGRTDEEAHAEAVQTFGAALDPPGDPPAVVCDDCYDEIMAWAKDKGLPP